MEALMKHPITNEPAYDFAGRHLVASFLNCDLKRLLDTKGLLEAMHASITNCGATLLSSQHHLFENGGVTAVMLLSESHASIHTYPEHGACFVDIFTCGSTCDPHKFDVTLRSYLLPAVVASQTIFRDRTIAFTSSPRPLSAHHEDSMVAPSSAVTTVLV